MKMINDIDEMYDINIRHYKTIKGTYNCPLCKGDYVSKETFEIHLAKKDCYDIKDLVADTLIEDVAFKWFVEVMEADKGKSIYNVAKFRKDRLFKAFIQTAIFCSQHQERRLMQYLAFMMLVKKFKRVGTAVRNMMKESNLRDFRMFLHVNDEIDDTVFVQQHLEDLKTDHHFLVRSLEKAEMSLQTLLEWDLDTIMANMPIDYKERIQRIAAAVDEG